MSVAGEKSSTAPQRDSERGRVGLLIVDMITTFDFQEGDALRPKAHDAAKAIVDLKQEVESLGYPSIYVNDNFGEWHSERSKLIERALEHSNPVSELIKPDEQDYFIIKPQFSGFYATNLQVLLPKLGVSRLILSGIATDICILFTAADAHMRDYSIWVPENAVAAVSDDRHRWALEIMRQSMGAETAPTSALQVQDWARRLDRSNRR
ncbi:cysteine hydrolase family protein [Rhizorhabdus argentea]|uniref:cysteine hydrolase family protein n=1 Tax=Rhizorhabdus argentea TaxID=1387174 RepID=UPI0030EC9EC5